MEILGYFSEEISRYFFALRLRKINNRGLTHEKRHVVGFLKKGTIVKGVVCRVRSSRFMWFINLKKKENFVRWYFRSVLE